MKPPCAQAVVIPDLAVRTRSVAVGERRPDEVLVQSLQATKHIRHFSVFTILLAHAITSIRSHSPARGWA
jgi:hypothetical protein